MTSGTPLQELPPTGSHPEQANQQASNLAEIGVSLAEQAALLQVEGSQAAQAEELGRVQSELVNADNPNRFNLAQRRLESTPDWTDETRMLAVEINRADQDTRGEQRLTFDDAKAKIEAWSTADMASDDAETKREGRRIDSALRGLSRPDTATQKESIGAMLADVEQTLHGYEQSDVARTPEFEAEIREYRAIRDALVMKQVELTAGAERRAKEQAEKAESDLKADHVRADLDQIYESGADDIVSGTTTESINSNTQSPESTQEPSEAQKRFATIVGMTTRAAQSPNIARSLADARGLSDEDLSVVTNRLNEIRKRFTGNKRDAITEGSTSTWVTQFEEAVTELNKQIQDGSLFEEEQAPHSLAEQVRGSIDVTGPYSNLKGVEAILKVAAEAGVSEKALTDSLLPGFEQLVAESQQRNPDKPTEAHTAFAANRMFQSMEQQPDYKRLLDQVDIFVGARKEQFGIQGNLEVGLRRTIVTDFLRAAHSLRG
jgi:hypothetical protein